MKALLRTPGRQYFISMFIIGAALFTTFSTVIYRDYDNSAKLNNWVIYNYELTRRARLVLINLLSMETSVRGYLLTGRSSFLDPYYRSLSTMPDQLNGLINYKNAAGDENSDVTRWMTGIAAFQDLLDTQVHHKAAMSKAQTLRGLDKQRLQMDALRDTIEGNIAMRINIVHNQLERSHEVQRRFLYILTLGTILAVTAMLITTLAILGLLARNKRANEETEFAEERFRMVMNGLGDGVYDFNPLDGSIYYSPEYIGMLGYSETEFPQTHDSIKRVLHPDDAGELWEHFERYKRREIPHYRVVYRALHKTEGWRWILSRGIGFWNESGELVRLIGTHTDISEQKQHEEQLSQLNSELETYTYIASHDLRSPLVNLRGFAKELSVSMAELTPIVQKIEPKLAPQDRTVVKRALENDIPEAITFILKSAERMDQLTTAVLDLSRIGKRDYVRAPVKVNDLIQKCLDSQAYEISRNSITITVQPLPELVSDALALEQIFTNLIDNAIKYLEPGRPGRIDISARETPSDVLFEVEDNGRGIAAQDLPKVFEIFRRARNVDRVRGQGMGMAFVKATVRKLGGSIWCTSTLGEGTVFYVQLPRMMKRRMPDAE